MNVTLLDGRVVDSRNLTFNEDTYHVYLGSEDVTRNMRQNDKVMVWPSFSRETDNYRAYNEKNGGTGPIDPLDDSTLSIFTTQILNDPLAAPLEAADNAIKKVWDSNFGKLAVIGIVGLLIVWGANKLK